MPRKGHSVRDRKLSRTVNDLQIRTQMIPTKKMKWHELFQRKVKNIKKGISHKKASSIILKEIFHSSKAIDLEKHYYSAFTETGATQTMKTNQLAELKQ